MSNNHSPQKVFKKYRISRKSPIVRQYLYSSLFCWSDSKLFRNFDHRKGYLVA